MFLFGIFGQPGTCQPVSICSVPIHHGLKSIYQTTLLYYINTTNLLMLGIIGIIMLM